MRQSYLPAPMRQTLREIVESGPAPRAFACGMALSLRKRAKFAVARPNPAWEYTDDRNAG